MVQAEIIEVAEGEGDVRLDRWFRKHYPRLGHGALQKLLRTGQIRVDGRRAKAGDRVAPGQSVRVPPLPQDGARQGRDRTPGRPVSAEDARRLRDMVVHEDATVLALAKPAGLAVQGGTGTTRHIDGMLDALVGSNGERPRLVHRLDRDTSGVLILARDAAMARELTRAFRTRDVGKLYLAITVGMPEPARGEIRGALAKAGGPGRERMVVDEEKGLPARTLYEVLDHAARRFALVALLPRTGRTHQLRAHLAAIGTPILGDVKYGGWNEDLVTLGLEQRMHLHARAVSLPALERRKPVTITAPLPTHMVTTMRLFGFSDRIDDGRLLAEVKEA